MTNSQTKNRDKKKKKRPKITYRDLNLTFEQELKITIEAIQLGISS